MTGEFERRMDAARAALDGAEAKTAHGMPVRKCPTRLQVRCPKCQHAGTVEVMLDQVRKLRCGKCGHPDPIIAGQSPLRSWSTKRRAGNAARRGGAP